MAKKFIYLWCIAALATPLLAGFISFVIDPYGLYQTTNVIGLNQQKEGVRNKIRLVKSLELPLRKPRTLIMGTSRVHDGINPDHPSLQDYSPVYNFAVDMNRIHETLLLLRHATENTDVKRVVLGLDFFMFNALQRQNEDFDDTLVGRKVGATDYLGTTLFSRSAITDSYKTVKQSYQQPKAWNFCLMDIVLRHFMD